MTHVLTQATSLPSSESVIAFTRGVPTPEAFPSAEITECFQAVLQTAPLDSYQYGKTTGYPPLRRLLADMHGVSEQEVMVSNGSLQFQDLLATHVVRPGSLVLTEQPTYDRAISTFRRRGATVIGVPLEADGISIERLEAVLQRAVPTFLYLIPDFQNPAGVTLSLAKRQAVVDLAERYGFWILEDVPYRQLRYQGEELPLIRDLAPQRVITSFSFSKILSPGLRVGYMVAPQPIVDALVALSEDIYLSPVMPNQVVVAEYLRRGWLKPNIARLKEIYRPRWQAMLDATRRYLPSASVSSPDGGFFVSVTLPPEAHTADLVGRAKAEGLLLTSGSAFFADADQPEMVLGDRFVRLPFCSVSPAEIEEGVRRLATLI